MLKNKIIIANLLYKNKCVGYRLFYANEDSTLDVYDVSKEVGDTYDLSKFSDRDIMLISDGRLLVSRDEIDNVYIVKDITDNTELLDTLLNTDCISNGVIDNMDSSDEEDTYEDDVYNDSDDKDINEVDFIDTIDDMYEEDGDCYNNDNDEDCVADYDEYCDEDEEYANCEDCIEDCGGYCEIGDGGELDFIDTIDSMYYDEEEDSEEAMVRNDIIDYLCGLYLKPARLCNFKIGKGIPVNLEIEIGNELKKVKYNIVLSDVIDGIVNRMQKEGYVYKSSEEFNNGMTEGTFIDI